MSEENFVNWYFHGVCDEETLVHFAHETWVISVDTGMSRRSGIALQTIPF
jgi:hypothetical protein